jgi:hypothetical protein
MKAYIVNQDGYTTEMKTIRCVDENKELQKLLLGNLDLIPGDQIKPEDPRRWILIKDEMPVPDPSTGSNRWSVDFFLVDHEGIPTFVECKRHNDSRSRREVIGQMLDYAANGHYYWSANELEELATETAKRNGHTLEEYLYRLDSTISESNNFFEIVENNLKEGQLRLVFFLEEAPQELKSIVDFLNRQMERTEVLIVEAKQYLADNTKVVVPVLFGYTEQARMVKKIVTVTTSSTRKWDEQSFFRALGPDQVDRARMLMKFGMEATGRNIEWGTGKERGSFTARFVIGNNRFSLFSVYTSGEFSVNFGWNYQKTKKLKSDLSEEYRQLINERFGVDIAQNKWENGWPMVHLSKLTDELISAFEEITEKYVQEIKTLLSK